ncbi:MAG: PEP-CTERM sorting domain-containing protein [Pseudomonadales bacterium]|nr:PEP-CTERM sorting domain-containing protein [Pseudomonadales bacterium]
MKKHTIILAGVFAAAISSAAHANNIITFEGFEKGRIIDNEYASQGVTIRGYNVDRQADNVGVIFDTNDNWTADPDLEAPFYNVNGQNLGSLNPGNVLIIHEHPWECNYWSCGSDPDDEGSQPAGYFDIVFDQAVTLNSIDFFDIEGNEAGNSWRNAITIQGTGDYGNYYTPATGGDNTWARQYFNLVGVTSLRIRLAGSGAIDNIDFSSGAVPAPSMLVLFLAGLAGLYARRRRMA